MTMLGLLVQWHEMSIGIRNREGKKAWGNAESILFLDLADYTL